MLDEHDIRIYYLKHLLREPFTPEITTATNLTITELEIFLKQSSEYKTMNNIFSYDYHFDNDTNVYTVSNLTADYSKGFNITNGNVGIESSYVFDKAKRTTLKDMETDKSYKAFDFTNLHFSVSNIILGVTDNVQTLYMNECKFTDTFKLGDLDVVVEKYPLHTYSSCFMQKMTIYSVDDKELSFSHSINEGVDFNSHTLPINNIVYNFSYVKGTEVSLTNVYSFEGETEYVGYDINDGIIQNRFKLNLIGDSLFTLYIISCSTLNSKNIDSIEYLKNIKIHPDDTIIDNHRIAWNKKWNTQIQITNKETVTATFIPKINYLIKSALFNVYSDIYSTDYIYHIPILILLKPNLAKNALNYLIKNENHKNSLFKSALLSIHTWNYFRTSRDKHWLQIIGFPTMQSVADDISEFLNDNSINKSIAINPVSTTNNALTNHMLSLALTYTNQAIYELDYLYIAKYKSLSDSLSLQYFSDNKIIQPVDTKIIIKLGERNDLFHYEFYDSQNTFMGYQFGGDSGYKMSLLNNTVYEFTADESLANHPFKFIDHINGITHLSTSNVSINSMDLKGYAFHSGSNLYSTFRENFNHTYGNNAFTTHTLDNVIIPYDEYTFDQLNVAEPYLIFNSYYNNDKFQRSGNFLDIVNDNVNYYTQFTAFNEYNSLLEGGLNGLLSQYEPKYVSKRSQMNLFYNKFLTTVDEHDPWNNNNNSLMTLFVIISCLFELTPQGETTQDRIMYKPYGLQYIKKNVLPDPFKQMSITNVGADNKLCTINNVLYVDTPFNAFVEGVRYNMEFDELNNTLTIEPDFTNIFPLGIPGNVNYKVLMEPMTTVEVNGELEPFHYSMTQVKNNVSVSTSNIVIPYTPISETTQSTTIVKMEQFYNKVLYLYMDNNGNESMTHTDYSVLQTKPTINPTIKGTFSFVSDNSLQMDMVYNSQDKTYYNLFDNVSINVFYDKNIIDSNITYDGGLDVVNYGFVHSASNYIAESRFTVELTNDISYVSANHSMGSITFPLKQSSLENISQANRPVTGTVTSRNITKSIIITNPEMFPPSMITVSNLPTDFVYFPTIFQSAYVPSTTSYFPINHLVSTNGNIVKEEDTSINLVDKHIYDIIGNSIYEIRDNTDNTIVEYFQPGGITIINDFITSESISVKEVFTTTSSTIILDTLNVAYGIGYNESFNLGMGNGVSITTFESCDLINALGTIKSIVLNDKATLIVLENNKVYGVGESIMFHYLSESLDVELMVLETPTELTRITRFIEERNYTIMRIDSGFTHFKFLLKSADDMLEWWGVGRNMYNSMGVGKHINYDFDVKYMTRLHQIERLIHHKNYDENYTGSRITDPNKYHLIRSKGIPSMFTAILDTFKRDVFVIGTLDGGLNIYSDWTKVYRESMFQSTNPQYYVLNENGLVVGGTDNEMVYL
jgi:hypothetical protein